MGNDKKTSGKRIEYKIVRTDVEELEEALNELAGEGWKIEHLHSYPHPPAGDIVLFTIVASRSKQ